MIIGLDEAGKGALLGDMHLGAVKIEESFDEFLKQDSSVKDSKLTSVKQRKEIFEKYRNLVEYEIIKIKPKQIDELNLTLLAQIKMIEAIDLLKKDSFISTIIIDCPSVNLITFKQIFIRRYPDIKIVCEHKADNNHKVVALASIFAKRSRDLEIYELNENGFKIGSGYPSDPVAINFYKKNKNSELIRRKWNIK